ncbi:hypothetical protein RI543_001873 [Arxiozyma heterogenica]|uniref:Potassium channel domain-containing protein n=1 Tax=Arxiozyma heterogenica TaxID=278026 RepID=A0AAN7ZYA0_9SACH|nr:hypothetical protein RI543_001873 [Kazachstania heterogenica]
MSDVESQQRMRHKHEIHALNFAVRDSLKFKNNRISIINDDPTKKSFVFWFFVSCYFPVITACLGPIANTISIACVVEKWRQTRTAKSGVHDDNTESNQLLDPKGIFAINVISLVLGFSSNVVLLCHFSRRLSYLTSQFINIVGWTAAGLLLMIDVIICSSEIQEGQARTLGFWYASFTSGLYIACTFTLTIHFIGYKLKKYPATFNLLPNERIIMVFTVFLSLWLIWGAGLFSGLMGISFGNSLYFCVVSLLTVGFGDIFPINVASKIMILLFSLSGIFILGLIVYMTRSIIQRSSGPVWYFHRLESSRTKLWEKVLNGELTIDNKEGFQIMERIAKGAYNRGKIYSILTTMTIFIGFWLLGALVFHFAEDWSFFNSMYFCFLCLLTIGYGSDFTPSTGAGRAFFVIWGIGAIPLMSALISTAGDLLFTLSNKLDIQLSKRFHIGFDTIKISKSLYPVSFKIPNGEIIEELVKSKHNMIKEAKKNNGHKNKINQNDGDNYNDNDHNYSNFEQSSSCKNRNHDSRSICTLDDILNKSWDVKQNNIFTDLDSISDSDDTDFDIVPSLDDEDSESVESLTKTVSNRPKLEFKKLQRLKHLFKSLRILHRISLENNSYKLSFQQWTNLHNLYPTEELMLTKQENDNFWISNRTPLKFPLNEPHFAFLRISDAIDKLMDDIMTEQQNASTILEKTTSSNASNRFNENASTTISSSSSLYTMSRRKNESTINKSC